jgi:hypothetical protein
MGMVSARAPATMRCKVTETRTMTPCYLLLAAVLVGVAHAQAGAVWKGVRGAELRAMFIDHELADGVHYASAEECFELERRGSENRFLRDGYEALSAVLSPVKDRVIKDTLR